MTQTTLQPRSAPMNRWDPFEEFEQIQQQLAQIFPTLTRLTAMPQTAAGFGEFVPLADLEETDDAYMVEMELPGIRKEDVNIELSGRRLSVTGERKEKERKGTFRRRTRMVGRFRFEGILPSDVNDGDVQASLADGVLTIRIPKRADDRPKQIPVQ